jgi:hypothetical protein
VIARMEYSDIYVTLDSSSSPTYYPSNTSSNFTVQLAMPISLPPNVFEVGLSSIRFTQPPSTVAHTPTTTREISKIKKTFFSNVPQNATIYEYAEADIAVRKPQNKEVDYLQLAIENEFKGSQASLLITEQVISEIDSKSTLTWADPEKKRTLELPYEIARTFGFINTRFQPGRHISETFRDKMFYQSLPADKRFVFKVSYWTKSALLISEPLSYSMESFISNLAESFRAAKHKIGFLKSKDNTTLTIKNFNTNTRFQLPNVVSKILGIDENFVFQQEKTVLILPTSLISASPESIEPITVVNWADSNEIYIHSDIIESQRIGSSVLPVMRIIEPLNMPNTRALVEFKTVHYLPPSRLDMHNIQLSLKTKFGSAIPATDYPTIAVLHFRNRWV